MYFLFVVSCLVVMLLSLLIAYLTKKEFKFTPGSPAYRFLFAHNNKSLASISNAGSMLSLTTILGIILSSIISFGTIIYFLIFLAVIFGFLTFRFAAKRIFTNNYYANFNPPDAAKTEITNEKLTLINLVDKKSYPLIRWMQIFLYVSLLAVELTIAQLLLTKIFPNADMLIALTLFFLCFMCATYVALGGFIGVLRTDFLQIAAFLFAGYGMVYFAWQEIPVLYNDTVINFSISWQNSFNYIAIFFFVWAYCFSWPDFWTRNVGALKYQEKGLNIVLTASFILMTIVVAPCLFFAVHLIGKHGVHGVYFLPEVIDKVAKSVTNPAYQQQFFPGILFIIIGSFCIFVSTIDSWLMGICQYWYKPRKNMKMRQIAILPYIAIILAFAISLAKYSIGLFAIGLLSTLILFGNFMIVIWAAVMPRVQNTHSNGIECKKYLLFYLIAGASLSALLMIILHPIEKYAGQIVFYQMIIGFIVLIISPAIKKKTM